MVAPKTNQPQRLGGARNTEKYSPAARRKPSHPAAQANSNNNNGGGLVARRSRPPPPPAATPSLPRHHPSNAYGQASPPAGALSSSFSQPTSHRSRSCLPRVEPTMPRPEEAGTCHPRSTDMCPRQENADEPGGECGDSSASKGGEICSSEEDGEGRRPPPTIARIIAAHQRIALGICRPHPRTGRARSDATECAHRRELERHLQGWHQRNETKQQNSGGEKDTTKQ